jgi:hypothetical protein
MLARGGDLLAPTSSIIYWTRVIDPEQDGSSTKNLKDFLTWLGAHPVTAKTYYSPSINFVPNYQLIPPELRPKPYMNATFAHWIVALSENEYFDPLYLKLSEPLQWPRLTVATTAVLTIEELVHMSNARVPYDRVMYVLPATVSKARFNEITTLAYENDKRSVSFSYDDAGIGDGLRSKTAILVDIPDSQHAAFDAFYHQWYPDTKVEYYPKA